MSGLSVHIENLHFSLVIFTEHSYKFPKTENDRKQILRISKNPREFHTIYQTKALTPVISLISSTVTDTSVLILEVDWRKVIALRKSPSDASIRDSSASALHWTPSFSHMFCNLPTKTSLAKIYDQYVNCRSSRLKYYHLHNGLNLNLEQREVRGSMMRLT